METGNLLGGLTHSGPERVLRIDPTLSSWLSPCLQLGVLLPLMQSLGK